MLEQIYNQDLCTCLHSISEEHENGICYALDFDGIWKACNCRQAKIKQLNFTIQQNENPMENTNKSNSREIKIFGAESAVTAETDKSIFQWGK